ncbi:hypothetical protein AVEN_107305-1 [Araneus ventricosus]|uniref:Uncharacterized protein n=1 Tax=Araneus ventricosus TaxID=182803 RepID=A0A4Y2DVJ0_ARAVE|nr:hypothetical protein AVEN_107305-1 [Araneus ventricosus]
MPTKSNSNTSFAESNLRPQTRVGGTSKDLTRLRPRFQARKSEICRVWRIGWIEERRSNRRGILTVLPDLVIVGNLMSAGIAPSDFTGASSNGVCSGEIFLHRQF